MRRYLLPENGTFYKVNMHSHSTYSDGKQTPLEIKVAYQMEGYSAVAFTEHEMMFDFSVLTDENFVAITSYEFDWTRKDTALSVFYEGPAANFNDKETVHINLYSKDPHDVRMVCHNDKYLMKKQVENYMDLVEYVGEPNYQREYTMESFNEVIRAARERNMLVIFNHPYWSMNTHELYSKLEGLNGLEIINGGSNKGSDLDFTPTVYTEMMRAGQRLIVVAGDDNHDLSTLGYGFTMVKAPSLSYENLMTAIENGDCYASNGPTIEELYMEDNRVYIKCSDAVSIHCYTAGRRRTYKLAPEGESINECVFEIKPEDFCFRLSVKDARGNHAYTRYYYLDEYHQSEKEIKI